MVEAYRQFGDADRQMIRHLVERLAATRSPLWAGMIVEPERTKE
jgi:hypothetical protein